MPPRHTFSSYTLFRRSIYAVKLPVLFNSYFTTSIVTSPSVKKEIPHTVKLQYSLCGRVQSSRKDSSSPTRVPGVRQPADIFHLDARVHKKRMILQNMLASSALKKNHGIYLYFFINSCTSFMVGITRSAPLRVVRLDAAALAKTSISRRLSS